MSTPQPEPEPEFIDASDLANALRDALIEDGFEGVEVQVTELPSEDTNS